MRGLISFLQGLVNIFFSARYRVEGGSMLPSLAHGESVLVVRTRFRWNRLRRGDVVVFERPGGGEGNYIKRVVGLPGEDLKITCVRCFMDVEMLAEDYIQGAGQRLAGGGGIGGQSEEWFNGPYEYFLLGDNRAGSDDSRAFGPVPGKLIKGRAWFQYWPPSQWRTIGRV